MLSTRGTVAAGQSALALILVCAAAACGGSAAQQQWSGPRGGLPYVPLPQKDSLSAELAAEATPAATPAAPAPIAAELPKAPPAELDRNASCTQKTCTLKAWLPSASFATSVYESMPAPTALWLEKIKAGDAVVFPQNRDLDVLGVVLHGKIAVRGDEGGAQKMLETWSALRAPGAGLTLRAEGGDAKILLGVVTDGGSLDDILGKVKAQPYKVRWHKRPGSIEVKSLKSAEDLGWGGGAYHVRIAFGGHKKLRSSLEVLSASPKASIAEHSHNGWESLAVLSGTGSMTLAGTKQAVKAGTVFQIPKATKHAYAGSGGDPLLAIQLYTPSGPERRFYKLAGVKAEAHAGKHHGHKRTKGHEHPGKKSASPPRGHQH